MPGISSKDQINAVLNSIEEISDGLAESATALSELIAAIEDRLARLPGRTAAEAGSDGITVSFNRKPQGWGLLFRDGESESMDGFEELGSASITRKARAFPHLLELLLTIDAEQRRQLVLVQEALSLADAEKPASAREKKGGK